MKEDLAKIQERVGVLVNWVSDMKTLTQNPYSAGLKIEKVLEDLGGYAADLTREIAALEERMDKELQPEEEKNEAN